MTRLLLFAVLIAAAVGQSSPSASLPERFEYMQGYGLGGHNQLKWEKGRLVLETVPFNDEKRKAVQQFQPSPQAWERFWKALDASGVWKWQPEYSNPIFMSDGDGWSVELSHAGHSLKSRGYNAQPPGFGAFRTALYELMKDSTSNPPQPTPAQRQPPIHEQNLGPK